MTLKHVIMLREFPDVSITSKSDKINVKKKISEISKENKKTIA